MDIVLEKCIKIPYSVVVAGLTNTDTDKEMEVYVVQFGSVIHVFSVDAVEFPKHSII